MIVYSLKKEKYFDILYNIIEKKNIRFIVIALVSISAFGKTVVISIFGIKIKSLA